MHLSDGHEDAHAAGAAAATTNNRMELTAVIEALRHFAAPAALVIHTDSTYVVKGVNQWLAGWKANNWTNAQKKPVANKELWCALDELLAGRSVKLRWVRGHADDPGNIKADGYATAAALEIERELGARP